MQIGILCLPTDRVTLHNSCFSWITVKKPGDINRIDGLIIEGSSIQLVQDLLVKNRLINPIKEKAKQGMPLWGIKAGMYLMASKRLDSSMTSLDLMDATATVDSHQERFTVPLHIQAFGQDPVMGIFDQFIYLPQVEPHVGIMAYYREKIVMARQGNLLVSGFSFPREECRPLNYFLQMVKENLD